MNLQNFDIYLQARAAANKPMNHGSPKIVATIFLIVLFVYNNYFKNTSDQRTKLS